jgi:hypothetical protein
MGIIVISRWSHSHGHEIARGFAEKLNYWFILQQVLLDAPEEFPTPETRLTEALHDATSETRGSKPLVREQYLEVKLWQS